MIKDALRDDREEEHPALAEADGRFDELLVDEDAVEDGEGRTEQHHDQSAQRSNTERDMRLEDNIHMRPQTRFLTVISVTAQRSNTERDMRLEDNIHI